MFFSQVKWKLKKMAYKKKIKKKIVKNDNGFAKIATITTKSISNAFSKYKKKAALGGFHGIALTKCFANEDPRSKEITKYLKEIF